MEILGNLKAARTGDVNGQTITGSKLTMGKKK